jgi:hypothetical protein
MNFSMAASLLHFEPLEGWTRNRLISRGVLFPLTRVPPGQTFLETMQSSPHTTFEAPYFGKPLLMLLRDLIEFPLVDFQ